MTELGPCRRPPLGPCRSPPAGARLWASLWGTPPGWELGAGEPRVDRVPGVSHPSPGEGACSMCGDAQAPGQTPQGALVWWPHCLQELPGVGLAVLAGPKAESQGSGSHTPTHLGVQGRCSQTTLHSQGALVHTDPEAWTAASPPTPEMWGQSWPPSPHAALSTARFSASAGAQQFSQMRAGCGIPWRSPGATWWFLGAGPHPQGSNIKMLVRGGSQAGPHQSDQGPLGEAGLSTVRACSGRAPTHLLRPNDAPRGSDFAFSPVFWPAPQRFAGGAHMGAP